MDILISSNLERLLYHLSDENGEVITSLMSSLDTQKKYEVNDRIRNGLADFYGGFADEAATRETIGRMYEENRYLMDTHTAVGYKVYQDYRESTGDETPTVIASTASAYKFADSVASAVGLPEEADGFAAIRALNELTKVKIPSGLAGLEDKRILHEKTLTKEAMPEAVRLSLK